MDKMKTLTIGGKTYEVVDEAARAELPQKASIDHVLPRDGSAAMTGALNFQMADNGSGQVMKNHSSAADYGTFMRDYDKTGKFLTLGVRANTDSVFVAGVDGNENNLLHTGNLSINGARPDAQGNVIWMPTAADVGVHSLTDRGTVIPSNADLNEYLTPGDYYVSGSSVAATIVNAPVANAGYRLIVETGYSGINYFIMQTAFASIHAHQYRRTRTVSSSGADPVWSEWKQIATTDYALPRDGSAKMTGNLYIEKNGDVIYGGTDLTNQRDVYYTMQDGQLIISTRKQGDNTNRAAIWFGPENKSLVDMLRINVRQNHASGTTYSVLHTGNSNMTRLVSSDTIPSVDNEINWTYG